MLKKATRQILERMDRMGFAGAGEALGEIECLEEEIKRLREECTQRCAKLLREAVAGFQADLRTAKAEIERLRREQAYSKETRTMQAEEIERLRELLKRQKAEIVEWLEGQGQPGYASQIHHTKWGDGDE